MPYSEAKALKALTQISDPLSDVDIIAAGRLADLSHTDGVVQAVLQIPPPVAEKFFPVREAAQKALAALDGVSKAAVVLSAHKACLLYTSPSPRDKRQSRMPSSA